MPATNFRRLQRLIDRAADASAKWHRELRALHDECQRLYGIVPGEVDADEIIDGVEGGCGQAAGMSARDFDRIMRERMTPRDL